MADIEKRSLIIREDFCKKQDEFFAAIQKYVWIDDLKAVYSVSGGTEIVIVSQVALVQARGLCLFFLPSLSPSTEISNLQLSCFSLC